MPHIVSTHRYRLHGLPLAVHGDDPDVLEAVHRRLLHFAAPAPDSAPPAAASAEAPTGLELRFEQGDPGELTRPAGGRPVYDSSSGEVLYFDGADLLIIDYGDDIRVRCEPERGRILVRYRRATGRTWLLSHPLVTLPLLELLKRRGLFSLHAAGVVLGGTGVLLAGQSGSGKSTLTLALLEAGAGFLSDDTVLLGEDAEWTHAFPDEIDLLDSSVAMFPRLLAARELPRWPEWRKRPLLYHDLFDAAPLARARSGLLLFPRVAHRPESSAAPMSGSDALSLLAPNVLLTEAGPSQRHLDALARLVERCRCYRFDTGTDLAGACARIAELATGAAAPFDARQPADERTPR